MTEIEELLDLERTGETTFRAAGHGRTGADRAFGGAAIAQSLMAAARTVDRGRTVHSLHAYFLRPGDPTVPIVYDVDRIRDGRSFTTRRVVAIQHGRPIFNLAASFHAEETGVDHQAPMPDAPNPETLESFDWARPRGIDLRFAPRQPGTPRQQLWMRTDGDLPEDPLLHVCVVAYASDMTLIDPVVLAHDLDWEDPRLMVASLDHAMWFHRTFRADDWLLYDQESASASGARGFAQGRIFRRDGTLAVSVAQEGLVRLLDTPK